jgi:threonine/homoserine/homoserine lactone efflux protein
MPDISALLVFVTACLALLITPGPAVLYIVARSIEQGRLAGLVSTAGISVGTLFHVAAAALGLSVFWARSPFLFNLLKFLGAGYLVYLGVCRLRDRTSGRFAQVDRRQNLSLVFWQGVLVNLLNPKTALFFLSFLPQFVDVEKGGVTGQIVFLGTLLVALGFLSDGTYALMAGSIAGRLRGSARMQQGVRYFAGSVYLVLGFAAATLSIS